MCYSALVIQHQKKLARQFGAVFDEAAYEGLFYLRLQQPGTKIPKAMDDAMLEEGGRLADAVNAFRAQRAAELEADLFKQTKRLADNERKLLTKVTKTAQEEVRKAGKNVAANLRRIHDLKRATTEPLDTRIFPFWYASVIVSDGGERWIRPLRYLCRPYWMPASSDFRKDGKPSGKYNARRDNIDKFWRPLFGKQHALVVATQFYEQIELPNGRHKELQFNPRTGEEMLIACLWSDWKDPEGILPDMHSFSAITDDPEPEVAATGHDRTIINIKPEHVDAWLSPDGRSDAELLAIFDDKRHPYYEHREAA